MFKRLKSRPEHVDQTFTIKVRSLRGVSIEKIQEKINELCNVTYTSQTRGDPIEIPIV